MRGMARLAGRGAVVALLLVAGERFVVGGTWANSKVAVSSDRPVTRAANGRHRRPRPVPVTTAPTTAASTVPATAAPTTAPTTVTPTTRPAATTVAPTTVPPTTVPPTTAAATTTTTTRAPTTTTAAPAGRFATLAPGSALPSGTACTARVRPAAETRPQNATYVATVGTKANTLYPRVDGQFKGTTDQVLQWTACKWGIDEDVVRAQIAVESWWSMLTVGDNGESFGLGQVRVPYQPTAFVDDNAKRSAAYNVDYMYAVFRSCYEGELTWLNTVDHVGTYAAGDLWGCIGVWFSGRWHTPAAEGYIAKVQDYLTQRVWTTPGFLAYTSG